MADEFLLLEDGTSKLLLEDGTSKIVLEHAEPSTVVPWRPVWTNRRQG
jgi:hypothetical protein